MDSRPRPLNDFGVVGRVPFTAPGAARLLPDYARFEFQRSSYATDRVDDVARGLSSGAGRVDEKQRAFLRRSASASRLAVDSPANVELMREGETPWCCLPAVISLHPEGVVAH